MLNKLSSRLRSKASKKQLAHFQHEQQQQQQQLQPEEEQDEDEVSSMESYAENLFPITPTTKGVRSSLSFSFSSSISSQAEWTAAATPSSSSIAQDDDDEATDMNLPEYEQAEDEFLEAYEDYFEHLELDNVRKHHYSVLETQRIAHLDYAASPLSPQQEQQQQRPMSMLSSCALVKERALEAQQRLLRLVNTDYDDYSVSFTTSLAAAFDAGVSSANCKQLLVCQDAHPAIIGRCSSARAEMLPLRNNTEDLCIPGRNIRKALLLSPHRRGATRLFVLPAQSGLSGALHSLNWVAEAQQNGWQVLLDATHYLPASGKLDLTLHRPDFVVGSLHQMVGGKAGIIQAFLLTNNKNKQQQQQQGIIVDQGGQDMRSLAMDFAALNSGLEHLENVVGLDRVSSRVGCLTSWLYSKLKNIKHQQPHDKPLLKLYGPLRDPHGSMLVFNLLDSTGNPFPINIVQRMADMNNIILGACHLTVPAQFSALRVSLGLVSNFQDVYRFLRFVLRFRDEDHMSLVAMGYIEEKSHAGGTHDVQIVNSGL